MKVTKFVSFVARMCSTSSIIDLLDWIFTSNAAINKPHSRRRPQSQPNRRKRPQSHKFKPYGSNPKASSSLYASEMLVIWVSTQTILPCVG